MTKAYTANHSPNLTLNLVSSNASSNSNSDKDFPTSSLRSASHVSSMHASSSTTSFDPLNLLASAALSTSINTSSTSTSTSRPNVRPPVLLNLTQPEYPSPITPSREIFPGLLENGRVTANHPLVTSYLRSVRRVANDRDVTPGDDPFGWKPKVKEDREVYEVLGYEKGSFTQRESDCIFVLAALKVYYNPKHRAHFTFWGKAAVEGTAERVQKTLGESIAQFYFAFKLHSY